MLFYDRRATRRRLACHFAAISCAFFRGAGDPVTPWQDALTMMRRVQPEHSEAAIRDRLLQLGSLRPVAGGVGLAEMLIWELSLGAD